MLRYYPTVESHSAEFQAQLPQLETNPSDLDFIHSPFDAGRCVSLEVILLPKGTDHGLTFDIFKSAVDPSSLMSIHYLPSNPTFILNVLRIIMVSPLIISSQSLQMVLMN